MDDLLFYRDRTSGAFPIYDAEVRQREPNILFPTILTPEDWDTLDIDPVYASEPPEFDPSRFSVFEDGIAFVGDKWIRAWKLTELPPPPPISLSADTLFFDRMTDEEYDDLDASVRAGETARVYRGWSAATTFTEGTDMWALLDKHLSLVVTAARKAELLASSDGV